MKNNKIRLLPNHTYHIYNRANGHENLFSNAGNYAYFLKRYMYFIAPIAETYVYCLMPNHFHFLIKIRDEDFIQVANFLFQMDKDVSLNKFKVLDRCEMPLYISRVFGNLFSFYTQSYNRQQNRKGALFIPNYKRKEVLNEKYFTKLIHYIHSNPVHHGFTKNIENWPYSSYNKLIGEHETFLERDQVMDWLGGRNEFIAFHKEPLRSIETIEF